MKVVVEQPIQVGPLNVRAIAKLGVHTTATGKSVISGHGAKHPIGLVIGIGARSILIALDGAEHDPGFFGLRRKDIE
ncbi:MAG: hypothetical protein AAFR21_11680 [Pseudomonadota bacterium]